MNELNKKGLEYIQKLEDENEKLMKKISNIAKVIPACETCKHYKDNNVYSMTCYNCNRYYENNYEPISNQ